MHIFLGKKNKTKQNKTKQKQKQKIKKQKHFAQFGAIYKYL